MWKKIISSEDLIVLENTSDSQTVRIEARSTKEGWNVIKRYYTPNDDSYSYMEDYYKSDIDEVKEIIKHIKTELLTRSQIKKIKDFKRNLSIFLNRLFNDGNIEKWFFSVQSIKRPYEMKLKEDGSVIIRYGENEIEIDIMMKEKLHHFEEQIVDIINEKLGLLNHKNKELIHNIFYYVDSASFTTKPRKKENFSMLIE